MQAVQPKLLSELQSPIGLIAGNGVFPLEFAKAAHSRGLEVVAVAYKGETDKVLEGLVTKCTWIKLGQLGKAMRALKAANVSQIAFVGGVNRVRLFGGIALDWRGVQVLSRLRSFRDDTILRAVAAAFESEGFAVFAPNLLLDRFVPKAGLLTKRCLSAEELRDARIGWEVARTLGSLDIGQTVIVNQGTVVAVEAVEGTDAAIRRAGTLSGPGAVVVKLCKPQQDVRLDLPALGPGTIESMVAANARVLIIEAEKSLLLNPDEFVRAADAKGLTVLACGSESDLA